MFYVLKRHESTDYFILLETEPEKQRSDDIIIVNYVKLQSGKEKRE